MYTSDNPSLTITAPQPRYGNHAARSKKLHQPNGFVPATLADEVNAYASHMSSNQRGIDGNWTNHNYKNVNDNYHGNHRSGYNYNNGDNGNYNYNYNYNHQGGREINKDGNPYNQWQWDGYRNTFEKNNVQNIQQQEQRQFQQQQLQEHDQNVQTKGDAMSTDGRDADTDNL